jgi:hypothetical protein
MTVSVSGMNKSASANHGRSRSMENDTHSNGYHGSTKGSMFHSRVELSCILSPSILVQQKSWPPYSCLTNHLFIPSETMHA